MKQWRGCRGGAKSDSWTFPRRGRQNIDRVVVASKGGKKTDLGKQGLSSVANEVVKNNLMGVSKAMEKKGWKDASGNKGKVSLSRVKYQDDIYIPYSCVFLLMLPICAAQYTSCCRVHRSRDCISSYGSQLTGCDCAGIWCLPVCQEVWCQCGRILSHLHT